MPLNIYTGNRMEKLVGALAGVLEEPLASPLAPEVIVVQSKGMQRWVAMELARRFGVWANCDYPFPNSLIWRLFDRLLPDIPADEVSFSPEVLTWRIMGLLPGFLEREEFTPLRRYLASDPNGLKLFQLAERIAGAFDQYTLYRPEMLAEWEAAGDAGRGDWQAFLWRALARGGKGFHRGRLKGEFLRRMTTVTQSPAAGAIPERVSLFGISYLPKYHMEILAAVSRITEVNLFLLSPTREFWSDIISKKAKARLSVAEAAFRSEGNPLLASQGKLGRDFSDMVIEIGEAAEVQEDLYEEPGGASLLQEMQADILNLLDSGARMEKRLVAANDRSIQIHSCHSPLREMEVLHDNILALLEEVDGLAARDIVVMTPDIETYAPYISSVFDGAADGRLKIPYSIADRRLKSEGQIAAALLKLLAIPGSRATVVQLLDILEAIPVQRRFDLSNDELGTIRGWLADTGVKWGIDEESRIRLGLPGYRDNSWRAGLDRLLLGYALPDENGRLFNGRLPYDEMEGAAARTLGKLADFIDRVEEAADSLTRPRTLAGWQEECVKLLTDFIAADEEMAHELAAVSGLTARIGELGKQSGFDGKVEIGVVREWLTARLEEEEKGFGFITGGVTFCAMLPMRSIPFRVVALIGMNDDAFPRQNQAPGFDLVARNPRRGDRSLRDEDRYLFLESILSARDCLYISYLGQSIKDNSELPPSVLAGELLDVVERGWVAENCATVEERLVTRHRLQAFSPDYFSAESPLFSFSAENCEAIRERRTGPRQAGVFLACPLAAPADEWKDVPLTRLLRFFDNPARFFLENRLGIRLGDVAAPLDEREPFSVEGLAAYSLKRELLEIVIKGGSARDYLPVARSRGVIPPAGHGEQAFAAVADEIEAFAGVVLEKTGDNSELAPLDFELALDGFRLTGRLAGIRPERMIRYRCAKMKAKDRLRAWIEHLVLNAAGEGEYPEKTLLVMTDGVNDFMPVEDAAGILRTILALYWQGLTAPLPFFPASSLAYAEKQKWDLSKAQGEWEDKFGGIPGEGRDPHFHLCFGHADPFAGEFDQIARALLAPFFSHLA